MTKLLTSSHLLSSARLDDDLSSQATEDLLMTSIYQPVNMGGELHKTLHPEDETCMELLNRSSSTFPTRDATMFMYKPTSKPQPVRVSYEDHSGEKFKSLKKPIFSSTPFNKIRNTNRCDSFSNANTFHKQTLYSHNSFISSDKFNSANVTASRRSNGKYSSNVDTSQRYENFDQYSNTSENGKLDDESDSVYADSVLNLLTSRGNVHIQNDKMNGYSKNVTHENDSFLLNSFSNLNNTSQMHNTSISKTEKQIEFISKPPEYYRENDFSQYRNARNTSSKKFSQANYRKNDSTDKSKPVRTISAGSNFKLVDTSMNTSSPFITEKKFFSKDSLNTHDTILNQYESLRKQSDMESGSQTTEISSLLSPEYNKLKDFFQESSRQKLSYRNAERFLDSLEELADSYDYRHLVKPEIVVTQIPTRTELLDNRASSGYFTLNSNSHRDFITRESSFSEVTVNDSLCEAKYERMSPPHRTAGRNDKFSYPEMAFLGKDTPSQEEYQVNNTLVLDKKISHLEEVASITKQVEDEVEKIVENNLNLALDELTAAMRHVVKTKLLNNLKRNSPELPTYKARTLNMETSSENKLSRNSKRVLTFGKGDLLENQNIDVSQLQ